MTSHEKGDGAGDDGGDGGDGGPGNDGGPGDDGGPVGDGDAGLLYRIVSPAKMPT